MRKEVGRARWFERIEEEVRLTLRRRTPPFTGQNRRKNIKKNEGTSVGTSRSAEFHCTLNNPRDFATFNGRKKVKR